LPPASSYLDGVRYGFATIKDYLNGAYFETMARYVLRLPERLARKVEEAAEAVDMLPTEYVRDLVREAFDDEMPDEPEEPDEAETDA
jgi:hypothetical protein